MDKINIKLPVTKKNITLSYNKEKKIFNIEYKKFISQSPIHYKNNEINIFLTLKKDNLVASFLNNLSLFDYIVLNKNNEITEVHLNKYFLNKLAISINNESEFMKKFKNIDDIIKYFDQEVEFNILKNDFFDRININEAIKEIKDFFNTYNETNILNEKNFEEIKKILLEKEKEELFYFLKTKLK